MGTITVICHRCRHQQAVDDAFIGQTLYCPVCNSAMRIAPADMEEPPQAGPAPPPPAPLFEAAPSPSPPPSPERAKLRLASDRPVSGAGRLCPKCGWTMAEGDVVCGACGWNVRLGRSMADVARRREAARRLVGALTTLLVFVGAGWIVWKAGPPKWLAAAWTWIEETEPTGASAPEPSPLPEPTPEMIEAARRGLAAALDARYPVVADGAAVELKLRTGRILRGRFAAGSDGRFSLASDFGPPEVHAFEDLDEGSRLRCDPAYRAERLEQEARRQLGL